MQNLRGGRTPQNPPAPTPGPRPLGHSQGRLLFLPGAPRPQNVKARPQGANAPALHFQAPSSSPAVRLTQQRLDGTAHAGHKGFIPKPSSVPPAASGPSSLDSLLPEPAAAAPVCSRFPRKHNPHPPIQLLSPRLCGKASSRPQSPPPLATPRTWLLTFLAPGWGLGRGRQGLGLQPALQLRQRGGL